MSKRRRKNKVSENSNQGNFMGGLNPQMLDMLGLGDVDVNKVSEVLSSMGSDGFDMNSINSILNNKDGGMNKGSKKGNMHNNPLLAMMGDENPMGDLSSLMGLLGGGGQGMNPMGNLGAIANMMGGNMGGGNLGATNNISGDISMDPIVTMILSLRNFVDPQRARFLDKVLKMYKEGKITY